MTDFSPSRRIEMRIRIESTYRPDLELDRFPLQNHQAAALGSDGHWAWIELKGCASVSVECTEELCVLRIHLEDGELHSEVHLLRGKGPLPPPGAPSAQVS